MLESVSVASGRQSTGRAASRADVLVLGHFKNADLDRDTLKHDSDGSIAAAAKRSEATGDLGRIVEAFPSNDGPADRVIIVGLGDKSSFSSEAMRSASASVGRRLATTGERNIRVDLSGPITASKADSALIGEAFGEALALLSYSRDQYKGSANASSRTKPKLLLHIDNQRFREGVEHGIGLGNSANVARAFSEAPPNICTPDWIAQAAQQMARKYDNLSCRVFRGEDLIKHKLTGIHTVGKASEHKPCLIRLEYKPKQAKRAAKPAVLVGKTLTYDSGGLSIKVNNGMRGMKRDMDGGAGVLGAMHAIATVVKPRRPVVALLACAENAISEVAYRPDDIMTFRNGVTVEVTNTDAEGRLVLADALCWACEEENPEFIIDMATLTGGVVVALGSTYAGMWCDDDALRAKIEAASARSGERVWRLPHHQEYRDLMKSDVADIVNSAAVRGAHPIQGAAFLSYFVEDGIPWCHLDIAGVHASESDKGPYIRNSATGFGTRLLADLLDAD